MSFVTTDPTMVHLSRFYSIMSREAEFFFRKIIQKQNEADLKIEHDAADAERAIHARLERRKILARYEAMPGTRKDRLACLRRELRAEGNSISYDGMGYIVGKALAEAREDLAEKIRPLADVGLPVLYIARKLEIRVDAVTRLSRQFGIGVEEDVLRIRLEETLRRFDAEGLSLVQMCNRLEIPPPIVKAAAVSAGIVQAVPVGEVPAWKIGDAEPPRGAALSAAIAQLAGEGLNFREIARKLRVCFQTVQRRALLMGVIDPPLVRGKSRARTVALMARKGYSSHSIGKVIGLPAQLAANTYGGI